MNNAKKVLFTILLILIPSVAITTSVYLILKGKEEVKGVSVVENGCTPYITNMIPNVAYAGMEYIFYPKIVGCNIKDVEIDIAGPEWLNVDTTKNIYGIPRQEDIGTQKVEITVTSPWGSSSMVEYLIIK